MVIILQEVIHDLSNNLLNYFYYLVMTFNIILAIFSTILGICISLNFNKLI